MRLGMVPHTVVKHGIYVFHLVLCSLHVELYLSVQLRQEDSINREISRFSQDALINQLLQCVSLEQHQEILGHLSR
jgi:hypothetical protein